MKYISSLLLKLFLRILAILPTFIRFLLSDFLYILIFYIAGYRKEVAKKNIDNSFPYLSTGEKRTILKKYYKHLADVILETAASLYYPTKRIQRMYQFDNPELINKYYDQGRHIILVTAHYSNWEWAGPITLAFKHQVLVVYKRIKNKYIDRMFRNIRGRYGAEQVPMKQIGRRLFECDREGVFTLTTMADDQRPQKKKVKFWTRFLNQDTPLFTGSERLATKFNAVVVFMKVRKVKRGKYRAEIELVTDTPRAHPEHEITEMCMRVLERLIHESPAYWLWTHDRWKYGYEEWEEEVTRAHLR